MLCCWVCVICQVPLWTVFFSGISRCFLTCYLYLFLTQQPGFHCKLAMPWLSSRAFKPYLKTLPSSHHFLVSHPPTLTELKQLLLTRLEFNFWNLFKAVMWLQNEANKKRRTRTSSMLFVLGLWFFRLFTWNLTLINLIKAFHQMALHAHYSGCCFLLTVKCCLCSYWPCFYH